MPAPPLTRNTAAALGLVALAVVGLAGIASEVPLKFDDLNYLTDTLLHPDDPLYWRKDSWYLHWRPLAYLVWWGLGPWSLDGAAVRVAEVATWLGAAGLLARIGWREGGWAGLAVALLAFPFNGYALETLDWKSWITSTGGALGLAGGLAELTRGERARPAVIAGAVLVALGFKEIAAFALGITALLVGPSRGVRAVGAIAVIVGLVAAAPAGQRLQPWSFETAWFYLFRLHQLAWVIPLAVARARPDRIGWGIAAGVVAIALPPLGGALVLGALVVLARPRPAWGFAAAILWGVVVAGSQRTPAYLLEGWLVIAAWIVANPPTLSRRVWAAVGLLGAVALVPWAVDRPNSVMRAAEQRRFLADFHPAPAKELYVGPRKALDLDALVWLQAGARVRTKPPDGLRPTQVGPRSCVWADPVPLAPGERADAWPRPERCQVAVGLVQAPERTNGEPRRRGPNDRP